MSYEYKIKKLENILASNSLYPVFQPIVSLNTGEVFSYEALTRISSSYDDIGIEELFHTAENTNKVWELEILCRQKALEKFALSRCESNLFLNVNPNIIADSKFKAGVTHQSLQDLGLSQNKITFEITERVSIQNKEIFRDAINYYKTQNYGIAIDDVGSGFSGLNTIIEMKPLFIKLDKFLIENIHIDHTKLIMCRAMVDFCKQANIKIIAEGIEKEEELEELIELGVDYGQGYFLGRPHTEPQDIEAEKKRFILNKKGKDFVNSVRTSIYPTVKTVCRKGQIFAPEESSKYIYEKLQNNPDITEFTIIENNKPIGFMTRHDLNTVLGGRYGYSIFSKKNIAELLQKNFLSVNVDMAVDQVAKLAMQRGHDQLYHPVVVEKNEEYYGIATIKDLLSICTKAEIHAALHANPLTKLPGNLLIEKELEKRLFGKKSYAITYYDLDNFKAYNDAYGFENGDLMLLMFSDILKTSAKKNEFIGHIGGDDFIVMADYGYKQSVQFCEEIIAIFTQELNKLYNDEDLDRGYIVSKNRNGITENFPMVSVSIAGVTSNGKRYANLDDFSRDVAFLKKSSKIKEGSCYSIM